MSGVITVRKMGLSVPVVARGIDPHKAYRQSCMTIDGPAVGGDLYSHDLAILGASGGMPALHVVPSGANLAATGNALKAFCVARGATISETGANAIAPSLVFLRDRLYLIWNGKEHVEMPLVDNEFGAGIDASNDAALKLRDCYLTGVITSVPASKVEDVVEGGQLALFVVDATGEVSIGALGGNPAGVTAYAISGTVVVNRYLYTDNAGVEYVMIDFVC